MPLHDVINTLVYCARASDVETTIIGGEMVTCNGVVLTVDERAVMHQAANYGSGLYERGVKMWQEIEKGSH